MTNSHGGRIAESGRRKMTLRDVASSAEVSVATVSRVLNASATVSAEKERRVRAAIEELGFRPSAAARALSSGRTRTVGAVIPTLDHAIFSQFLDTLEYTLRSHGLSLVVATTGGDLQREARQSDSLIEIGAEALVVSGLEHLVEFDEIIERSDVPVVATSCHRPGAAYPTIGYDNAEVVRVGLDHLYELGHRRIAVVHGPTANNDRTARRVATAARDRRFDEVSLIECPLNVGGGAAAMVRILGGDDLSAAFCLSDVLALGCLFEAGRKGVPVPERLSIVGVGDLEWTEHSDPPLTTIALPVEDMGVATARALSERLALDKAIETHYLPVSLLRRGTTRRIG